VTTAIEHRTYRTSPTPSARITKLAHSHALHGDALAFAIRAVAGALDSIRSASGLPLRTADGAPIAAVRLFSLELRELARGDQRASILRATALVAAPTCLALRDAALHDEHPKLATEINQDDLWHDGATAPDDTASARAAALWRELEEGVFDALVGARLDETLDRVQARAALLAAADTVAFDALANGAQPLYENRIDRLSIAFTVDRVPFASEVLDPRIVRIPPGKSSENHRHAHESLFYVLAGEGAITVGPHRISVRAGHCVFVPRWTMHQSHNTGAGELRILGVTDFTFTSKAQVGSNGQGRLRRAPGARETK
jgi:mannose-6-phosphate isomerase-like protein (cupin superfamily)